MNPSGGSSNFPFLPFIPSDYQENDQADQPGPSSLAPRRRACFNITANPLSDHRPAVTIPDWDMDMRQFVAPPGSVMAQGPSASDMSDFRFSLPDPYDTGDYTIRTEGPSESLSPPDPFAGGMPRSALFTGNLNTETPFTMEAFNSSLESSSGIASGSSMDQGWDFGAPSANAYSPHLLASLDIVDFRPAPDTAVFGGLPSPGYLSPYDLPLSSQGSHSRNSSLSGSFGSPQTTPDWTTDNFSMESLLGPSTPSSAQMTPASFYSDLSEPGPSSSASTSHASPSAPNKKQQRRDEKNARKINGYLQELISKWGQPIALESRRSMENLKASNNRRSDTSDRFRCPIPPCESEYTRMNNLQVHMHDHFPNRVPVAIPTCEVCGRKTSKKSDLTRHMKKHR